MTRSFVETAMGAIVLLIAGLFVFFAYSTAKVGSGQSYTLTAKFDHVDGLQRGSAVQISGIKVGEVVSQELDPKTFQADVTLWIDDTIKVPVDTVASVSSNGLLGDKFLQLVPGGDDKTIPPGGALKFTQSPVSLESLIGQAVFSMTGNKSGSGAAASPSAPSASGAASSTPAPSGPAPSGPTPSAGGHN